MVLAYEYMNADRAGFTQGIEYLADNYECVRRVRGDGNCFYRAFLFAYLETILRGYHTDSSAYFQQERVRMLSILTESKDLAVSQGYEEMVIETFYDVSAMLKAIK